MIKKNFSRLAKVTITAFLTISMLASCSNTSKVLAPAEGASTADLTKPITDSPKPTKLSIFMDMPWYWTDKWEGIIPEEITKRTGVTLDVTRAADDKQLGVLIASDNLPDLVFTGTGNQMNRLSDSKFSYDYDSLMAKYTPTWKPSKDLITIGKASSSDGKYYFVKSAYSSAEDWQKAKIGAPMAAAAFYRKDMAEKYGIGPINTLDDLLKAFETIKAKAPGVTPLIIDPDWKIQAFKIWNGVPNSDTYKTTEGKIDLTINNPNYKSYLKYVNTMYKAGDMLAENFAFTNASQSQQYVIGNKAFAYTWCDTGDNGGSPYLTNLSQKSDPNANWVSLMNLGGDKSDYTVYGGGWAGTFITKKCTNPEVAIKFVAYMNSEEGKRLGEWGREGTEYTLDSNGLPKFSQDWLDASKDNNILYKKYNPSWLFGQDSVTESAGRNTAPFATGSAFQKMMRANIKVDILVGLSNPKADTDEAVILTKLQDLIKVQEVKIILSKDDATFEANYAAFMKSAKSIGVSSLIDSLNKAYVSLGK